MENAPAVIGVTLTGVAMMGALLLYVIRGEIRAATKPIQPDSNEGRSLPDVVRIVQDNGAALEQLRQSNRQYHILLADRINVLVDRLDEHAASPGHDRRRVERKEAH